MNSRTKWGLYLFIASLMLILLFSIEPKDPKAEVEISYSELKRLINDGNVQAITLRGDKAQIVLQQPAALGPEQIDSAHARVNIPALGDPTLMPLLEEKET